MAKRLDNDWMGLSENIIITPRESKEAASPSSAATDGEKRKPEQRGDSRGGHERILAAAGS